MRSEATRKHRKGRHGNNSLEVGAFRANCFELSKPHYLAKVESGRRKKPTIAGDPSSASASRRKLVLHTA